jgi:hypothetical protein
MNFIKFEYSCLLAIVITFVSDIVELIPFNRIPEEADSDDNDGGASGTSYFDKWTNLNPSFLEMTFEHRSKYSGLESLSLILGALSTFALIVPIAQVSWILSHGGRRSLGLHSAVVIVAMVMGMCELIVALMTVGARQSFQFITDTFELKDWNLLSATDDESGNDGTGYRVLELIDFSVNGITTWMNAFEGICLCIIMTLLFLAVRGENLSTGPRKATFGQKWSYLGLLIGYLCLFEFLADVIDLQSTYFYGMVSFAFVILNSLVLIPVWLFVLGRQLPSIRYSFENNWGDDEQESLHSLRLRPISTTDPDTI